MNAAEVRLADPDARKLLDDIASMSVADIDRERLVNRYLDALIRVVEPERDSSVSERLPSPEGDAYGPDSQT